jgi:hypothetical protein
MSICRTSEYYLQIKFARPEKHSAAATKKIPNASIQRKKRKKRRRSVAALGYTRRRRAWPGDTHTLTPGHRGPFARVRTGRFGRGAHETFSPVVVMVVVGRSSGGRTQPPGWLRRVAAVRSRPRATGRARERGVSRR